jgi:uncharacterized spore protein YtfJ
MTDTRDTSLDEAVSLIDRAGEQVPKILEKLFAAAQPSAVFGQPVDAGSYTLITAAEVTSGGGFGVGMAAARRRSRTPSSRRQRRRRHPQANSPSGGAALEVAAGPWGGRWRSSPSARTA